MEALTRLVTDSLARHGFNRPVDLRRLKWSRWFRCDSPHSLLVVPSKSGIFAIAEEVMDLASTAAHDGTVALGCPAADPNAAETRRMLAVLQFSEDDDMAFTMDRMFTKPNVMRDRLAAGRCFLRFVVIEDEDQRRSICSALNQWLTNSAEKASGISASFASSLEFTDSMGTASVGRTLLSPAAESAEKWAEAKVPRAPAIVPSAPNPDSGANKNLHCPQPFPSGF